MEPLWKTVWCFLKKLKMQLPYDPEIPTSVYPEKTRGKDTYSLQGIHNSQDMEVA